jgi:branched-chain amino acid transport system substrate-binding protein
MLLVDARAGRFTMKLTDHRSKLRVAPLRHARLPILHWLALLVVLVGCGAPPEPPTLDTTVTFTQEAAAELPAARTYRIGMNTEVTGAGAQIGDLSIRAARLAIEEINAAGGVNGIPLELVVRDSRSDPDVALGQYRAAIAEDDLAALLGPFKSAYAVRIVPEHRNTTLPMLIGATNATLTQQGDTNLFRMRPSDKLTAAAIVALAVERLNAQHIGIIHDADAFGSGGAQQVVTYLAQRGLSAAAQESYTTGAREFDAQVQAMLAADIDALLIYGTNSTDVGVLLRSVRYWKLDVPIITSPGGASPVTRNVASEAQDGIYVAADAVFNATPEGQRFEQAFVERFDLQPDTYIAWYYDAIYMLANALRDHGPEPQALSRALRDTTFVGAQGAYRFDDAGEGLHRVTLARMAQGKATPVGVYDVAGFVSASSETAHVTD